MSLANISADEWLREHSHELDSSVCAECGMLIPDGEELCTFHLMLSDDADVAVEHRLPRSFDGDGRASLDGFGVSAAYLRVTDQVPFEDRAKIGKMFLVDGVPIEEASIFTGIKRVTVTKILAEMVPDAYVFSGDGKYSAVTRLACAVPGRVSLLPPASASSVEKWRNDLRTMLRTGRGVNQWRWRVETSKQGLTVITRGRRWPKCVTPEEMAERGSLPLACRDESAAVNFFEAKRWPDGYVCIGCGSRDVYQMMSRAGGRQENYRLRCKGCGYQYTMKTGSVFEDSPIPLHKWAHAFWLLFTSKDAVPVLELQRVLQVTYRTAMLMMERMADNISRDGRWFPSDLVKAQGQRRDWSGWELSKRD
jgi:transposase-like protein